MSAALRLGNDGNNLSYTGLLVIGKKASPEGFEMLLECYIDTPTGKQPPLERSGELCAQ